MTNPFGRSGRSVKLFQPSSPVYVPGKINHVLMRLAVVPALDSDCARRVKVALEVFQYNIIATLLPASNHL